MPMKYPPHPGRSIFRDCMEPLGMSLEETATKLDISPEELSKLIRGESSITFALAIRLDKLFGCGASTWYQLQAAHDQAKKRNRDAVPDAPEPLEILQQTATIPLEHGRVVYKTYDAEVIELQVVPADGAPGSSSRQEVDFHFVGAGPGAVSVQMIYQPSADATPLLVADALFRAYLEWNAEADEYFGRIDGGEWDRESRKLEEGKEIMNALFAGLKERPAMPELVLDESDILREAEELLHNGTAFVTASALAGV